MTISAPARGTQGPAPAPRPGFRRRTRPGGKGEGRFAVALLVPAAVVVFGVVLYPVVRTFVLSLHDVNSPLPGSYPFVGLQNYVRVFQDSSFYPVLGHTLYFTLLSTSVELTLGIAVALLLNAPLRARWLWRSIVILPWALPTIVNALMWRWIDNAEYGSLNALLTQTGLIHDYQPWLSNSDTAMWMVIVADVWKLTPLCAILLLAALQSVDREVVEVAQVDGAGPVALFRHIVLPLITPVVLIVLVLRTMEAFKVFDIIWIMTHGGPANSTQSIAIYAYQTAYQGFDFGRGAALGYLIALVIMVLAAVYLRLLGRVGR
jgi:ABC-type sugar transport system permease subunit